jgi:polyhydroxyalkanoate synthesis regulator phasin
MFITPLIAVQGAIELFKGLTGSHNKKEEKTAVTEPQNPSHDVHHMSFEDLSAVAMNLVHDGKLSEKDANSFLTQMASLQQSTGLSKDAKIDMIQLYQEKMQNLNTDATPKNTASLQQSLDILNGIKARSGVSIPNFV